MIYNKLNIKNENVKLSGIHRLWLSEKPKGLSEIFRLRRDYVENKEIIEFRGIYA